MTDRERFLALLYTGPLLRADAVVVLAGEDAEPRLSTALELMRQGAAPLLVLTGGLDDASKIGADRLKGMAMGKGMAPDRIITSDWPTNTRDQADQAIALAWGKDWKRILLVASAYHMARAELTFINRLAGDRCLDRLQIVPVPAFSPWGKSPEGMDATRLDLMAREFAKIEQYQAKGDCASYEDGIAYLQHWEAGDDARAAEG